MNNIAPPAGGGRAAAGRGGARQRNARGQGARLTADIVTGAIALIERSGSQEAVTLRAVAREIGITAPSIYAHFADREAIMAAVVARIFDELTAAVERARDRAGGGPAARLIAGCQGYAAFGLAHPARYGVLFAEHRPGAEGYCEPVSLGPDGRPLLAFGAEAFAVLVQGIADCARAGESASTDVVADATAIWVALHGAVTLRTALPGFPWPEPEQFVAGFVTRLARLRPAGHGPGPGADARPPIP